MVQGVAAIITREETKFFIYIHCYAHTLNLVVADTVKQLKICRDALDTALKITRLINFSPKRNVAFDRIKSSSKDDACISPIGIHTFAIHGQSEGMPLRVFWSTMAPLMLFGKSACRHKPDLILMSKPESLECSHRCQPSTTFLA